LSCIDESFAVDFVNKSDEDNEAVEEQNCKSDDTAEKCDNEAVDPNVVQVKTTSVRADVEVGLANVPIAAQPSIVNDYQEVVDIV